MIELPPDITFVIQIIAFVVFWQLMRVILFLPMQRALAARAQSTSGARARAEALQAEAARLTGDVEVGLAAARAAGLQQVETIRRTAGADEQEIAGRYRAEVAVLLERERALTEGQVGAARAPLHAEADRLAASVVAKVLGRAA